MGRVRKATARPACVEDRFRDITEALAALLALTQALSGANDEFTIAPEDEEDAWGETELLIGRSLNALRAIACALPAETLSLPAPLIQPDATAVIQ
jgi:hypothetical protein